MEHIYEEVETSDISFGEAPIISMKSSGIPLQLPSRIMRSPNLTGRSQLTTWETTSSSVLRGGVASGQRSSELKIPDTPRSPKESDERKGLGQVELPEYQSPSEDDEEGTKVGCSEGEDE